MRAILLCIILFIITGFSVNNNEAYLEVRNDYSFTLKLYVKCGKWLGNKFEYEKLFIFPSNKTTNLIVPSIYKKCQIWPSHKW